MRDIFFTDGACRKGFGAGAYSLDGSDVEDSFFLGKMTNNQAEYSALIRALQKAKDMGLTEIEIFSDSLLMIKQMNNKWRVKNNGIKVLWEKAKSISKDMDVKFSWVNRGHKGIEYVDDLAGKALKNSVALA